jgi:hypothetical protein
MQLLFILSILPSFFSSDSFQQLSVRDRLYFDEKGKCVISFLVLIVIHPLMFFFLSSLCLDSILFIPHDIPFTKVTCDYLPVDANECSRERLVNVTDIVNNSVKIISANAMQTFRVQPLLFSRLPRGGKTTILKLIFEELSAKREEYLPIIVSANGNFALRPQEAPHQGLIRLIAEQFIELPASVSLGRNRLKCSAEDLKNYIDSIAESRKVVLLIDELNQLGAPIDPLTSSYIKSCWLDRENYYLVYTSHIPLQIDMGASSHMHSPSSRSVEFVELPRCKDIGILSGMPGCEGVTPLIVSLYAGIPSLIYNQMGHINPSIEVRFDTKVSYLPPSTSSKENQLPMLKDFLRECMSGEILPQLQCFACFADYIDINVRIWPLCYMKCILEYLGEKELCGIEQAVKVHASSIESGKDWELITLANFYLVALDAMWNPYERSSGEQHRQKSGPLGIADGEVKKVVVSTIPGEVTTMGLLKEHVDQLSLAKGTIIIMTPAYSSFPIIDGLIGYVQQVKPSPRVIWKAFQNKLSRQYPTHEVPDWIQESFLLSGNAPKTTHGSSLPRWTYLTKSQLIQMLCFSLRPLYPTQWGLLPESDDVFKDH